MRAREELPLPRKLRLLLLLALAAPAMASAEPPAAAPDKAAAPEPAAANGGNAPAPSAPAAASSPPSAVGDAATPPSADPKVAGLRSELNTLMDDLVAARARAAVLGKTLFKTRVAIRLQNLAGNDPVLAKVLLSLDGANVYRGDAAALGGDEARRVFEGFAAPGPHVLSVEVEQRARDDSAYGYTLHERYKFQATREKETEVTLVLDDDSNLASDFPDDGDGEYDVRVRMQVKTKALGEK